MLNTLYANDNSKNYGALLLRLTLGTLMFSHGLMKVYIFTIPGTVAYFEGLGLPPIAAYLTMFGEVAGGLGLLTGVLTRLAALLSIPLLMGATWAHSANGFLFSNAGGGWEFPVFLIAIAITVTIQGPGAYSLGRVLSRMLRTPRLALA